MGDSGLPVAQAGHCDWQRPHSVQVAMSSMPFQVKSSILPRPKMSVSGSASSKSSTLPPERIGCSAPQAVGAPGEQHVQRGQDDVQVLGVGDEHTRKPRITASWARMNVVSSALFALRPSGASQWPTICEANAPWA